jgi:hypothetical protein
VPDVGDACGVCLPQIHLARWFLTSRNAVQTPEFFVEIWYNTLERLHPYVRVLLWASFGGGRHSLRRLVVEVEIPLRFVIITTIFHVEKSHCDHPYD